MKPSKNGLVTLIILALMSAVIPAKIKYTLAKDYVVTIHGTSNLHDWEENVGKVTGNGFINRNKDESFDLNYITIKMEVRSIKSDKGTVMDNNTYKALKSETNPQIIFSLEAPVKSIFANTKEKIYEAKGKLTIAGVTQAVVMNVKIFMREKGILAFEGSQFFKMNDYNISPPIALMGMLKTGNEITLKFKTNFIPSLN